MRSSSSFSYIGARSTSIVVSPTTTMRAAVAREAHGELERVGRRRRGAQEHRVEAEAARDARRTASSSRGIVRGQRNGSRRPACELDGRVVEVDADDAAARRLQEARRELPDEPEPDDADPLADARASPWRTPCSAIAPTVAYAASSKATPPATGATRFCGTATISAWFAQPPPPHATRSPGAMPSHPPRPRARHRRTSSRAGRALRAGRGRPPTADLIPSTRARSTTFLTRSGRARAFWRRFFSPVSTFVRSVPALIRETWLATSTHPGRSIGAGTSTTLIAPSLGRCATCFTTHPARRRARVEC